MVSGKFSKMLQRNNQKIIQKHKEINKVIKHNGYYIYEFSKW